MQIIEENMKMSTNKSNTITVFIDLKKQINILFFKFLGIF